MKLQQELGEMKDNGGKDWTSVLKPIADHIVQSYKDFLPKLVYPIRNGEHTNSAFGLIFAYDYGKCEHYCLVFKVFRKNLINY